VEPSLGASCRKVWIAAIVSRWSTWALMPKACAIVLSWARVTVSTAPARAVQRQISSLVPSTSVTGNQSPAAGAGNRAASAAATVSVVWPAVIADCRSDVALLVTIRPAISSP
jgi:hypothetical protein